MFIEMHSGSCLKIDRHKTFMKIHTLRVFCIFYKFFFSESYLYLIN